MGAPGCITGFISLQAKAIQGGGLSPLESRTRPGGEGLKGDKDKTDVKAAFIGVRVVAVPEQWVRSSQQPCGFVERGAMGGK